MSRETLEYRPAHSCATLANGILMAEHGDHAAVSPSLEEQIKAFLLINMLNSWFVQVILLGCLFWLRHPRNGSVLLRKDSLLWG